MLIRPSPRLDESFEKWYKSASQTIARAAAQALGCDWNFTIGGVKCNVLFNLGWMHSRPNVMLACGFPREAGPLVVASAYFNCGITQFIFMNNFANHDRDCPQCAEEKIRYEDAMERVGNDMIGKMTRRHRGDQQDGDGGSLVGARPSPKEPQDGEMLSWP